MNDLTNALRVANVAFRTIRVMDAAKKIIGFTAAALCCVFALKFWKNR